MYSLINNKTYLFYVVIAPENVFYYMSISDFLLYVPNCMLYFHKMFII